MESVSIFPPCSTNVLIGTSNCGKSSLLKTILKNYKNYFGGSRPSCAVIVYCNNKTPRWGGSGVGITSAGDKFLHPDDPDDTDDPRREDEGGLLLEEYDIEDFDLDFVRPHSVLIFEDVSVVHSVIKQSINVGAHHIPLQSVFLVTQNLTGGSDKHFELSQICHRILFCLKTTSASNSCKQTISRFFSDPDTKKYLGAIQRFCERTHAWLLLEMNSIASHVNPFRAFSHINHLSPVPPEFANDGDGERAGPHFPYALAYPNPYAPLSSSSGIKDNNSDYELNPELSLPQELMAMYDDYSAESATETTKNVKAGPEEVGRHCLIVVPLSSLVKRAKQQAAEQDENNGNNLSSGCVDRESQAWERVKQIIFDGIELAFHTSKWRPAKNLAQDILDCDMLCLEEKGKFMWIKPDESHDHNGRSSSDSDENSSDEEDEDIVPPPPPPPLPFNLAGRSNKRKRQKYNKWLKKVEEMNAKRERKRQRLLAKVSSGSDVKKVNILNFIRDVIRPSFGKEKNPKWKYYRPILKLLLDRGTSEFLVKNSSILKPGR